MQREAFEHSLEGCVFIQSLLQVSIPENRYLSLTTDVRLRA